MILAAFRRFLLALAVAALAACHSSGGNDTPPDSTAPSTPAGVVTAPTGPTTVNVTWNAATDSGGSGLKDYVVYRGSVAVAFVATTSYTDSGLTASTLYSYQIAARDNANNESGRSAAVNATTLAAPDTTPPSVPMGVTATATSATTVNVSWGGSTDPGGSGVKEYIVYRGGVSVATVTTTSFTDSGLTPNTLYAYEILARDNADNESKRSAVVTATTAATPDTAPPSVPSGLTAAATSATTVHVSWSAVTDAGGSGIKDYTVYRNNVAVATVVTTSFADTGLTASTLYAYEVSARDNALNVSGRSVARNVTTPATSDTTPPSVPGTLMTSAASSTEVDLVWGAATDNVAVTGYSVERCVGAGCASFAEIATATGTSFSDTRLAASTSYSYRIRARDVAGNAGPFSNTSSTITQVAADAVPPSAPGPLTASAASFTQIHLSWGAATDNIGVTAYRVERCAGVGCSDFAQIATPAGTSFSDTALIASTSYSYRVRAVDAALNPGEYSNTSSATTVAAPDVTPPNAPATLTSSAVSDTQINLSWSAATDDVGVTGYRVERCEGAGCSNFAQIATPTGTSFSDTGLMASTSYSYRVRAVDAANNPGAFSNTSSVTTPDTTPPSAPGALTSSAISSLQIDLSWGAATDDVGVTGYRVERCTGPSCSNFAQIATPTGTSYSDTGLTGSTSYTYRISAVDAAANVGAFSNASSATTSDITPPSAPGTLISSAISSTQIDLSWSAATDDVGVTGYRVERCNGVSCTDFAQIATPIGTSFSDAGLTASTSYRYRVRAIDAAGNPGPFSNTSSATTPDTSPPSAPSALTSSAVTSSQIDLSWNAATDDVGVTGYRVERCTGASCTDFAQIATPTGTSFSDTGLTASTSYRYRVRAVDAAGNPGPFSNISSATTPDTTPPSAPGTLTSSAVSSTQIDLSWGAATDDVGVTGYRVERCTGASCANFAQIATPAGTSFSDTGLAPSTSYRYRVRAVDAAGNPGAFSNTSSTTTPDTTPPSAPGTLTSSAVSSTQIDLSWNAATDDVGVTGYRIERCTGAGCTNFAQIATPTGTSYSDTGLTPSTAYRYRVRAVDAANNPGAFSNTSSATTPDTSPPGAPGTLTSSAISSTQIDLSWGAATDDVGVTGYRVERCTGAGCGKLAQIATATGTSYNDTGLTASTSYTYRVRAVDAAGNPGAFSNTSSATTPDTTPPSAPGTLTSNAVSSTQIDLSWSVATDDVGVTGYRVERCTGAGCGNFAQIATPTGTSYSDTGLTGSASYSYHVRAVDAAGNPGPFSNISSVITQAPADTTPPSAPGTLTSSAVSSTQIDLSWGAATDDVGVTGYRVERCAGASCSDFAQIAMPAGTSFSDTGLTAATSYRYRVRAVDAAGNPGAFSNTSSATTPDTTPPSAPGTLTSSAISSTQIDLSWSAATDDVGVSGYRVERCTGAGCGNFAQIATPTGTSFSDTGLTASTSYTYRVRAVDAADNPGAFSNTSSATTPDTTPPSAPGTLTSSAISSTQIDLSWSAASDDVGVMGYRVERCTGPGCSNFAQIATPAGTSFSDTGLTAATSYRYRVRAVDAAGNPGPFSNISSATTPDTTPPSAPGTLTSSAVSSTQIDLSWGAATDDVGVTGYRVERCSGVGCANFAQVATPTGTSYSDTGLTVSASYSYRVRAVDAAGNPGAFSNTSSVTTPDTTPPSVPGTLSSSAISSTQIDLSWGAATDDVGVTGYRVERCSGVGCASFAQIATPTGTSYSDTGLTASTSYTYRVRAVDAAGNAGAFSNTSSATTPDTTPPSAPGTLTSNAVSSTQIDLSWSAATDDVGVTGYRVERCSGASCANFAQIATPTGTSFSDTGRTASTSYSYRVRAVDAAGNPGPFSNVSSATTPDTTPPSGPGTLTSSAVSSSQIDLSWGAATDDVGVTGYRVERCAGASCTDFAQIATATGTSYSDTGLTPSTSYRYRVRAVDAAGNAGAFSNTSSATTPDTTPPSAPGTLTSNAVSSTQIDLSWGAATDDVGVTGYRVERCTGAGCGNFAQIATPTGTSFSDTGLTVATSYSYRVRAVDAANNAGAFSNTSSATTPDTTPPSAPGTLTSSAVSSTQVDLSWGAATDDVGVTWYPVERCTGASCANFALIATPTGTTFSDTGRTASTSYSYRVRAVDAAANPGAYSNTSTVTTLAGISWGLDTRPSNMTCVAPARTVGSSTITITPVIDGGLSDPVAAVQAPGDNSRWFVVERTGRILAFNGNPTPSVFLDITSAVRSEGTEAGLLGLAFHPDFANNGKLYVFYSGAPTNGSYSIQSRIAEFTSADRATVVTSTERVLLRADKGYTFHNGGHLAFGPDGFLYASLGDGGSGDDPHGNGQSLLTLFGKVIRIDVNGTTGTTPYAIPPSNPYAGNTTCPLVASGVDDASRSAAACPEIYASGFRNPWRFSLDRGSAAPDLWVGDVGEDAYEEINRVQLGGNYGWDVREGPVCHEPTSGCSSAGLTDPIVVGPHSAGMFSIIGGFVYRGSAIPSLQGRYLFTDFLENGIHVYDGAATNGYTTLLADSGANTSAFAEGNNGELYLVDFGGGRFLRIDPGSGAETSPVPPLLSETGCVVPGNPTQPASGLIPYAPNAPFWSDGAGKDRWLALPDGAVASLGADGDWVLPPGSVLMKNFRLQNQLIETRLLMRHPDGEWAGYTYQWNDAQTEATRVPNGAIVPKGTPSQNWIYPSGAQCLQCHTGAAGRSLGLENGQLNHPILYPQTNRTANQITTLAHIGMLPASMPDASTLPVLPDPQGTAPLAQRARAYLHTNCSFCHRPGGGAPGAMDLRYDTPMNATNACNATPTSGNLGVPGAKLMTPANPAASVLYLRMSRRGASQMPPVGSSLVDTDGAALVEQWILQMNGTCN